MKTARSCFAAVLLLTLLGVPATPAAQTGVCQAYVVGTDTTRYQVYTDEIFGESAGQSFMATDTLIRSISVWRVGSEPYVPMRLWITRTGPDGWPLTDGSGVLLRGPILEIGSDTASIYPPKRIKYDFDPPFQLPGPGLYAFFIQEPCWLLYFDVFMNLTDDLYPQGRFFRTFRSIYSGCGLNPPGFYPDEHHADLIFEVEFCRDATTPTRRTTWGQVKVLYR